MMDTDRPWFIGAWRRRSIVVPGGEPCEPCTAWWIQAGEAFVDVRLTLPGQEHNGLPYSTTRAFAGRFEIADGVPCWHVELDTDDVVPRVDRGAPGGLFVDSDDPLLMIEDAPGRFREEWVQCAPLGNVEFVRSAGIIAVRAGGITAVVMLLDAGVYGRLWDGQESIAVGPRSPLHRPGSST